MRVRVRRAGIALLAAVVVGGGATAVAASRGGDGNHDGMIRGAEAAHQAPRARAADSTTFANLNVTAHIDRLYCASAGVQCAGSSGAAANGNASPVRVVLQVLNNSGAPVGTLTTSSFQVQTDFVPAGGSSAVRSACAQCFQSVPANGEYVLFLVPSSGTWKTGHYYPQISLTLPSGAAKRALADIEIP